MNKIYFKLGLLSAIFFCCYSNNGFAGEHPSTCNVKIAADNYDENGNPYGLIAVKHSAFKNATSIFGMEIGGDGDLGYVDGKKDPTYPDDYGTSVSDTYTFTGGTTRTVAYYLYAVPNEGYEFSHWATTSAPDVPLSSDVNYKYTSSHSAGHIVYNLVATFRKTGVIKWETNNNAGYIDTDKEDALTGDMVTAKAILKKVESNINMMTYFSHWEDGEGNKLSEDPEFTFEAKPMTLRAFFGTKDELPQEGKYYRIRNAYNRVLTVAGDYTWQYSINVDVPTSLLRWALPLDHDASLFNVGSGWEISDAFEPLIPEASPGTIFYVEAGSPSGSSLNNVSLTAQGVNTYKKMNKTFSINPMFDFFQGYYSVNATVNNTNYCFKAFDRYGEGIINVSTPNNSAMCAFAIQPIDEDHIDDFWFGAFAEEEMLFEDGYWSTMYTTFPYQLYDEGVEAYYVKAETEVVNGTTYIYLTKIDDGFIPANSAVLLKCREHSNTKANRMLPLDPYTLSFAQKNKTLEGNILKGELQLYTNAKGEGRKNFDENTMRIMGVNAEGQVGFYKLAGGGELKPNKAYLDLSQLPSQSSTVSFKLASKDFTTGIESIEEDGSSIQYESNNIYDLSGQRVKNPQAGSIYVVNGKKVIWK